MAVGTRKKVLALRDQGLSQGEIARRLEITPPAVSYHVNRTDAPTTGDLLERDHRQLRDRIVELAEDIPMTNALHIVATESGMTYGWLARLINGCTMTGTNHPNWDSWSDTALIAGFNHNRKMLDYARNKVEERETIDDMMKRQLRKRGLRVTND